MTFKKGDPKPVNSGVKKGHITDGKKVQLELREIIRNAFNKKGGETWLLKQMDDNPKAFLALLGRVLPQEINGNINVMVGLAERIALARKRDDLLTDSQPIIVESSVERIDGALINERTD